MVSNYELKDHFTHYIFRNNFPKDFYLCKTRENQIRTYINHMRHEEKYIYVRDLSA